MDKNKDIMDIAKNKLKKSIYFLIISILTFIIPIITGYRDFGIFFEISAIVSLIISIIYLDRYEYNKSKVFINISLLSVILIMIYDVQLFFEIISNNIDFVKAIFNYAFGELIFICYIINLVKVKQILNKNNMEKKENTDWLFYKDDDKINFN